MKRVVLSLLLVVLLSASVFAAKGYNADTIYFDVKMSQEIGMQEVIAGNTDIFFEGLTAAQVNGLTPEQLSKVEIYAVPSLYYDFFLNPYPNAAPYSFTLEGKEYFNPLAITEVRMAMNFLINRKYVVDEIIGGSGFPMYTVTVPGQPGTYKYELNASKLGFSAEGDQSKAFEDIENAMNAAAELPENKGKLVKKDGKWLFNNEPVLIKFVIRADDPAVRLPLGNYFSLELEKAGFTIEKIMIDRYKTNEVVYNTNPANFGWSMLTEAWGAGATRRFWDHIVGQMYAPYRNYMPGRTNPANWRYINDELDALVRKAYYGQVKSEEEYWDVILKAQTMGLKDALRINIAVSLDYYLTNKNSFNGRMAYGLGDGLNDWSIKTAKSVDKVLKVTQFSSQGSLFMSQWDPVGFDGITDTYSRRIVDLLTDPGMFESPVDAMYESFKVIPLEVSAGVTPDENGELVGTLEVPADAIEWDAIKDEWVKVGEGRTAKSTGTYTFNFGKWHHGIPMSIIDYMFDDYWLEEWRVEDYPGDPFYEVEIDQYYTPTAGLSKGVKYDIANNTYATWTDTYSPDSNRLSGFLSPSWSVHNQPQVGVTWEVIEAMGRMAALGSESGTKWAFTGTREGTEQVNVLSEKCVNDIKAELQKMLAERHIPAGLKGFITEEEVIVRYMAAIKFIKTYGHAYISDGGYYLAKYDTTANYAELKAVRDGSYPFDSEYLLNLFARTVLDIENIETPMLNMRGKDIVVKTHVNQSLYPNVIGSPATVGKARITLITNDEELVFDTELAEDGIFVGTIPGDQTKALKSGSYTILVEVYGEGKIVGEAVTKSIIIR